MKFSGILIALGLMLPAFQASAQETGVALKDEIIRKEPYSDAKQTGMLKAGDKVSIVKKDGGWLNVKSGQAKGWVRMLSIRKGGAARSKSVADSLKSLASGRTGTGHVVATTGIRGLDEEDLKSAKFNASELGKAESYAVSRDEANKFAGQGKLKARSFEYLPVPK